MIDIKMAQKEIDTGLSAVCAWCEHWHNSRINKVGVLQCDKNCGGPSIGNNYPEYKGPMIGNLHKMCFICGKESSSVVEIKGRMIGVCNRKGPERETCLEKLKNILKREKCIVKEILVQEIK